MIEDFYHSERYQKDIITHFTDKDSRYKTLFEQVNASVFLIDLSGKIIEANVKSYEMFHYHFEEMENKYLRDLLSPSLNLDERIEEIIAHGGSTFEAIALRKDYTTFPVEINTSLFSIKNQPFILILLQDISLRKENEQRLQEQQKKYHRLFESTNDGMVILDGRGEIIDINKKALSMLQFSKNEIVNQNLLNLGVFSEKAITILIDQIECCLNKKKPSPRVIQLRDVNGDLFDVELCSFLLYKENEEVETFAITFHDLRELQRSEKELEKTKTVLHLILKHSNDAIYYKNKQNTFLLVNMQTAHLFNIDSTDQIIGKTEYDFLPYDLANTLAEEDRCILLKKTPILDKSFCIHLPYGISKEITMTKIPHLDENNDVIGLLGIIQIRSSIENIQP